MNVARFDFNPFDRGMIADPFPVYEQIREAGRVVWNETLGLWAVPGYDDCLNVLTDTQGRFGVMNSGDLVPWFEAPNMVCVDGAEHDRLRRCLAPFFTRQTIAKWESRVSAVVDEVLTPLIMERGSFAIVADFTRIPNIVMADMLGIPESRYDDFQRWSHAISSNVGYGHEDPAIGAMMREMGAEANACLSEEIDRHRREQPDDLITAMLQMSEMSEAEIRSTAMVLMIAGYDTTAKLLGNSVAALAAYPDQRRALVKDPSLVPAAVEEVLRWAGVAHLSPRRVLRDTVLAGTSLTAGDTLFVLAAAANRDPNRWDDPHRFDIHRKHKSHIAFGFGVHLCLGAALARLEAKVALQRLLALAPDYSVREIDYGTGAFVRGPELGYVDVISTAAS